MFPARWGATNTFKMRALLAAATLTVLLAVTPTAEASMTPPLTHPTLCEGRNWTECPVMPGSTCSAVIRNGQILVYVDSCIEVWWSNPRRRVRERIRRHRL
jgi:hypothetical protein